MPPLKPLEEVLTETQRTEARQRALTVVPRWYSPWGHLAVTCLFGLAITAFALSRLHNVQWWELAAGAAYFLFSNASEWRIHKDLLHKRFKLTPFLYDRHTPEHHVIFVTDDMAVRSTREFYLVLIPPYGIILAFVGLLPLFFGIWLLGQHNLAALFCAISMLYIVFYECAHLSFHLAPDSWIGRRSVIRFLRRHHSVHHDPRLMQKWNFNIWMPLWDVVRRTYYRRSDAISPSK